LPLPERTIEHVTKTITHTEIDSAELAHELEQLQEAAVWQLNAALEAGWDDATDGISNSYATDERNLRRRWLRSAA
jgi:mannose/cellobiose epimerase-like protein (N-acyl-D-glucosamine 2-epimerase family)